VTVLTTESVLPQNLDKARAEDRLKFEDDATASKSVKFAEKIIERTPKFVGSFGKLKGFLRKCLDNEILLETQFQDLVSALDDISDHGKEKERLRHITVMSQPIFNGSSEQEVENGLGLMEMPPPKIILERRWSLNEGSFIIEDDGVSEIATILRDPNFNCRTRGVHVKSDVQAVTYGFTTPYNLVGRYQINVASLDNWVSALADQYLSNPYHNWMHAFDVFQFLHISLASGGAGEYFNFQDILAILVGAISHDVAHGGTNNAFLVNTGAKLAITYNDHSPLENMHASVCFELLNEKGNFFLDMMKPEDYKKFRTKVIDNILATDMTHHFELCDMFTERVACNLDGSLPFVKNTKTDRETQKETKTDRHLMMRAFTHMADLSHCTRPWNIHKTLVTCLEEEFFSQGDQEKQAGLPISPMMDRSKDSAATGQGFFLNKLVRPMLEPFCTFLTESLQDTFKANLEINKDKWAALVAKHGKLAAKDLLPLEDENE